MGNCCHKKKEDEEKKTHHQRGQPSTVSYDFERQKGLQRALRDAERRKPIVIKAKSMGPKRNAFR